MSNFLVSKCICHSREFTDIKEYAEQNNYSEIQELQKDKYCSCKCGLCIPYIEMIFETGETEFEPGAYLKEEKESVS